MLIRIIKAPEFRRGQRGRENVLRLRASGLRAPPADATLGPMVSERRQDGARVGQGGKRYIDLGLTSRGEHTRMSNFLLLAPPVASRITKKGD